MFFFAQGSHRGRSQHQTALLLHSEVSVMAPKLATLMPRSGEVEVCPKSGSCSAQQLGLTR
jgi:hypothetical protein